MKKGIHPANNQINVVCSCGNTFKIFSTLTGELQVEVCSSCHPFYTGKQKLLDSENRVGGFMKKYGSFSQMTKKYNKED